MKKNKNSKIKFSAHVLKGLLHNTEVKNNIFAADALLVTGILFLLAWVIIPGETLENSFPFVAMYFINIFVCWIAAVVVIFFLSEKSYTRVLLEIALIFVFSVFSLYSTFGFWCSMLAPVLLSIRYVDPAFTVRVGIGSWISLLLSGTGRALIDCYIKYIDLAYVKIPDGTDILVSGGLTKTLFDSGIVSAETVIKSRAQMFLAYTLIFIPFVIVSTILTSADRNMILESAEKTLELQRANKALDDAKTKMMISQLQPHFLYNSLSAIMAIDGNPPETVEALADFSKYLRGNLDSMNVEGFIPFQAELDHIEHYIALEKLRFGDKLNVKMDIDVSDFLLPALSVQMLVENAVKHGITPKQGNGTVKIETRENLKGVFVNVSDDGVGFDVSALDMQSRTHVGIVNSKARIERLTGGTWSVESAVGKGTTVRIFIPKEEEI